ncbi:expansin family protein [Rhodotorula toruloides]|uniref:Expansin family protein n=1 Tax=Rhodotorula toruloides TaxID=5286 RepID=A0A511KG54_RHOTO|nr:expansin family protein [Rhodotorula toruloides]
MPSFTSLVTFLSLALPLAFASAAHYSHPRNAGLAARNVHGRVAGKARALPRSGRRLSKRQEATLKCLTAYTFALCDGDNCTDMGSVAAGTMCKDGAITWDTGSNSAPASSGVYSPPAQEAVATTTLAAQTTPAAAKPTTTTTTVAQASASVDKKLVNNAVQSTSSPATAQTSAPAVQLNVGGSGYSSSDSSSTDSSSGEWVCDETSTSSAALQTSANTGVQFVQTSVPAPTTTTTTSAPAQISSSSSGGAQVYNGKATYYYQYGVAGSCGQYNSDNSYIIALSYTQVDGGSHCGQKVHITNTANGQSIEATVADTCPACAWGSIDLSVAAFEALGSLDSGVLPIQWSYVG